MYYGFYWFQTRSYCLDLTQRGSSAIGKFHPSVSQLQKSVKNFFSTSNLSFSFKLSHNLLQNTGPKRKVSPPHYLDELKSVCWFKFKSFYPFTKSKTLYIYILLRWTRTGLLIQIQIPSPYASSFNAEKCSRVLTKLQ